jgi:F-type H+-transporting ATPase subunit b
VTHLFAEPEFWVLVAVLIFVGLVWKPAKRLLIGGLDARAERIREELETARRLLDEAERALASYRQRQGEAAAEAEAIVAHAKTEAERIAQQSARELEEALRRRRRLAEERIAQEEARALAEIRVAAVDIAIAAARRIIAAELDQGRGAALIDAAIAALGHQLS